ncbi:hypothetical protein TTHERM_00673420 (macronuclear) [Tetrahymena thermophila SB210]|uniref:Uncharacterized protein n=1 Tax=Tetrahymena thermophila (strain SB210) TaxID=312017 RepID=Q23E20_TETTS|nr:hypothetical protein TTHERM_00673420 [Tetrahymena thermophila SB210]EAR94767.2 hypothetical protein TTHERM_00673420 [Tetrahymena thermophila SB210]|eukprot:XP_001015012.2 hypothetical protein TTHERM_00673420 [Tetrahymena thermophila SB210]
MASQFTAFLAPSDYYKMAESAKKPKRDFISQQQKEQKDQLKRELVMMKRQAKTVNQLLGEDIHKKNKMELNKLNWYYKKSFAKNKNEKYLEFQGVMHKLISNIKNSQKDLKEIKKKNDSFRVEDIKSFTISEIHSKEVDKQKKGNRIKSLKEISNSNVKQSMSQSQKMTLSQLPFFSKDFEGNQVTNEDINNDENDNFEDNQGSNDYIIENQSSTNFDRRKMNQKYSTTLNIIKPSDLSKDSTDRQVDFAKFNKIINKMQKLCEDIIPDIKKLAKTKKMQDKQFKTDKIRLIEVLRSPNYANQKQNMKLISNEREELHPYLKFLGYDNIEQIPNLAKRPRMEIVESRYLYNQYLQIEKKSFQQIKDEQTIKERNSISSNFERSSKKSLKRSSLAAVNISHNNNNNNSSLPQYKTARNFQQTNSPRQDKIPNSQRSRHSNIRNTDESSQNIKRLNSLGNENQNSNSFIREKTGTSSSYFQRKTANTSPKRSHHQIQRHNSQSSFTHKVNIEKLSPTANVFDDSQKVRKNRIANSPQKSSQNSINSPLTKRQNSLNSPELKVHNFAKYPQLVKSDLQTQPESLKRQASRRSDSKSIDLQQQNTLEKTNLGYQSVSERIKKRGQDQKFNQFEEIMSPKMLQKNIFIRNSLDLSVQIQKKFNLSQQSYMSNSNRRYSHNQQEESVDQSGDVSNKIGFLNQEGEKKKKNNQNLLEGFSNYFNKFQSSYDQSQQDQKLELNKCKSEFLSSPIKTSFERKNLGTNHMNEDPNFLIQSRKSSNDQIHSLKEPKKENYTDNYKITRSSFKQKTEISQTPINSVKNYNKKQISFTNNNSYRQNQNNEQNSQSYDKLNTFNRTLNQSRFSSIIGKGNQNLNETKSNKELSAFSANAKTPLKKDQIQQGKESDHIQIRHFHQKNQNAASQSKNDVSFIGGKKNGLHIKTEESEQDLHQQNGHHHTLSHSTRNLQTAQHKDKNDKQNHEVADIFNTMTLQDLNIMRRQVEQLRGKNNEIFNNIATAAQEGENKFQKGYQQIKREMLTYKEEKDNIVDTWEKKQLLQKQKNRKQIKEIIKSHYEEQERVEKELYQQNQDQMDQLIGQNYFYSSRDKKQSKQRPSKNLSQKLTYEQLKLKNMRLIQQAKNITASKKLIEEPPITIIPNKLFQSSFSQKIQETIRQINQKSQNENSKEEDYHKNQNNNQNSGNTNNNSQPMNLMSILTSSPGRRSILQNKTNNSSNQFNKKLSIITGADDSIHKNNTSLNDQFQRNNYSSVINLPNLTAINGSSIDQIMSITDRNILNKTDQIEESKHFIKEINNSSITDSFLIKQMEEFIHYNQNSLKNQSITEKEENDRNQQHSNRNNKSYYAAAENESLNQNKSTINVKEVFDNQETKNSEKRNVSLKLLKEKQQQKQQIKEYLSQVLTRFNRTHSNQSDEIMKQIRKYRRDREKNQINVDFDQMNSELQKKQNEFLLMMSAQTEEMKKKKKIEDILWQTQQRMYSNKKFDPTKFYRDELNWQNTINEATEYQEGLEGHMKKVKNTLSKAQKQGSPSSKLLPLTPAQSFIQQAKKKIGFKQQ